jgi:hypothetical protein
MNVPMFSRHLNRRSRLRATVLFLVAGILVVGVFTPVALAGKKKKATVVVVQSSTVSTGKNKQLKVSGHLDSARACLGQRSMRLYQTDQNGVITGTLATTVTGSGGSWNMQVQHPGGSQYFKVKAKKRVTAKFVCRAGFSPVMAVPNPSHPPKPPK